MGQLEDAVIYATKKHNGAVRKVTGIPAILHSMEVAHIISTITNDVSVMIAGLLHDVVEDTDGTLDEIRELFGDRIAKLVESETENKYEGEDKSLSWKKRKEESIKKLRVLNDRDVEILWLADKLSNIRSLANGYSEKGDVLWQSFNQNDPKMHQWYYKTVAEVLEMHLNRTGAFIAGIPTAISFGIVTVGNRYGSMFELLESNTVSTLIAANPEKVNEYAVIMANIAKTIHTTNAEDKGMSLDSYMSEVYAWIDGGIAYEDEDISKKIRSMIDELPNTNTLIHGDFHTGNVMNSRDEYILIDMDRLSICHPIVELCGLYMFYVAFGEIDTSVVESFMGFSYDVSKTFFEHFMKEYLGTEEIQNVVNKAALLCYVRLVRRCYKKGINLSETDAKARDYYMSRINVLLNVVDSFEF